MSPTHQLVPAGFSLAAVLLWGTSDFVGGYAARRTSVFLFTAIVHGSGALLMLLLVLARHSQPLSQPSAEWALAAGFFGGISLAIFYRALAAGKMGITAPVAAVLSAAIPAAVGIFTAGMPGGLSVVGFGLAGAGLWLISRSEGELRPARLGFAVLAGIGFAGFYLCMKQAGSGSAIWIALLSRLCSLAVTGAVTLLTRNFHRIPLPIVSLGVFAGCLDVTGSVLFVRAAQTGRLDSVVVLSSLYPAVTVLLARVLLKERFSRWRLVGMAMALLAVPLIALQ
jgi:drug/metabolite transporter (DMT)-like permease